MRPGPDRSGAIACIVGLVLSMLIGVVLVPFGAPLWPVLVMAAFYGAATAFLAWRACRAHMEA